jgi:hypothetical protein
MKRLCCIKNIKPNASGLFYVNYNRFRVIGNVVFIGNGVNIRIFAKKINSLCNAIAGRVREPRRIVIPGPKEHLPREAKDLHHQVEAIAEVQVGTKARAGHIPKAVMPKDQHIVRLTEVEMANALPANLTKEVAMVKDQPASHTKEVAMVKDQLASHTKEVAMAKGQPAVRLT